MELTPELLDEQEFPVVLRGYDTASVDDFLERVGAGLGVLLDRLDQAGTRMAEMEAELADGPAEPGHAPPPDFQGQVEQVSRALVLAQEAADKTTAEARLEADRLVADARTTADGLVAQANADVEARIGTAEAEVEERAAALRAVRDRELADLAAQQHATEAEIVRMRHELDEQRRHLQAVAAAARAVLDGPELADREDRADRADRAERDEQPSPGPEAVTSTVATTPEPEPEPGAEPETAPTVEQAPPPLEPPDDSSDELPDDGGPPSAQTAPDALAGVVASSDEPPTELIPTVATDAGPDADDGGPVPADQSMFWRASEMAEPDGLDSAGSGVFDQDDMDQVPPAAPLLRAVEPPDDDPFLAALRGDDAAAAALADRPADEEPSGLMRRLRGG